MATIIMTDIADAGIYCDSFSRKHPYKWNGNAYSD
jgi:hypothetical protein